MTAQHFGVSGISREERTAQSPPDFQGGRLPLRDRLCLCGHSRGRRCQLLFYTARALLCAQGCSFPPKLLLHVSDPGSLLADTPDLLQGCLPVLLRFLLSPETCQPSSPSFPLPSALSRRAGTPQASPLIVFSVWQVE